MSEKKVNLFDMVLMSVCALVVLDTVGASAAIGMQSFTLWIAGIFLYFMPYGLICAELGSSFPQDGGLYVWIRKAYGDFLGTMTSWFFWINNAYWIPSVYVLFTGMFASIFAPDMPMFWQAAMGIGLVWLSVAVGIMDLRISKWVPNIGAIIKMLVLGILGFFGLAYGLKHGFANQFSMSGMKLSWNNTIVYGAVIVYNFMGLDVISTMAEKVKNARRDIPKAILLTGILTSAFYIFATFGLLCAIPYDQINIVTGITDAFYTMFVELLGVKFLWLFKLLSALVLFTFFSNVVVWALASNNVMGQTGLDAKAPAVFGHRHKKYGTPDYAFYIFGVVATVLLIGNYIGIEDVQQIFWNLFALSSLVYLIPYLLLFPGVIILRKKYPNIERPYVIPGGKPGLYLAVFLAEFFMAVTCIMFFVPPEGTVNIFRYEATLIFMILLTALVGVWLYQKGKKGAKVEDPDHISL